MDKPFAAYQGDLPYIFVCYAHADAAIVYPEIQWLVGQGINIWYDEGIPAGKNWRAEIGRSLERANKVLFYVSRSSLSSDHCNREINLALDEGREVVPVYLEELPLTPDLKVGLNRVQALHRDQDRGYRNELTVIVTNYNGRDILGATLQTLRETLNNEAPILLVDDGSEDGSVEWVQDNFPEVHVLSPGKHTGRLNVVRNVGLRAAKARYLFLMDNDVLVTPDCIQQLLEVMRDLQAVLCCTPRLLYADEPHIIYADGIYL